MARDPTRGEAAMARLQQIAPKVGHAIHYADLSKISDAKRVAYEIAAVEPRVNVLINNAGAIFGSRELTEEGLKRTFSLNHMAYFVLTHGLIERLKSSTPARIINTASDAHTNRLRSTSTTFNRSPHMSSEIFWNCCAMEGLDTRVYARSKLCNILLTRELAKGMGGTEVTADCFCGYPVRG